MTINESTVDTIREVLKYMIGDWNRWRDVSYALGEITNSVFNHDDVISQIKMGYNLAHAYDYSNEYDDQAKEMHSKIKELAKIFGVIGE